MNLFKTAFLMALLTGLFLVVGALIGGGAGMAIAFLFAAGMNLFGLLELRQDAALACMARARWTRRARPIWFISWSGWRGRRGLPMPKVFIAENPQPNAFATGRNPEHAAVCVTSGLAGAGQQRRTGGRDRA